VRGMNQGSNSTQQAVLGLGGVESHVQVRAPYTVTLCVQESRAEEAVIGERLLCPVAPTQTSDTQPKQTGSFNHGGYEQPPVLRNDLARKIPTCSTETRSRDAHLLVGSFSYGSSQPDRGSSGASSPEELSRTTPEHSQGCWERYSTAVPYRPRIS
jgi:hypothetical protein